MQPAMYAPAVGSPSTVVQMLAYVREGIFLQVSLILTFEK